MKYIKKILLSINFFMCLLFQQIKLLFCNTENEVMMHFEEGEITVVGADEIELVLRKEPCEVIVELVQDQINVPCNPHHHDHNHGHHHRDVVDWYIKHHHRHPKHKNNFVLKIEWQILGVRTIRWFVKY